MSVVSSKHNCLRHSFSHSAAGNGTFILRKENEATVGKRVTPLRREEGNMYIVLPIPDTIVAQWE